MRNIEKNSTKYLIIQILAFSIAGILLWPTFDWLICVLFTHTEFIYSVTDFIIEPILFGCLMGLVLWILENRTKTKSKKKAN
ncbi:MAG: hypothetical protein Q4A79_01180 [Candidatus Saccharibacteria bacterium]|nr:hypothetical protein [Candidatus Saccharibacteria bacterium]